MADQCHMCLLGLIILCSLLTESITECENVTYTTSLPSQQHDTNPTAGNETASPPNFTVLTPTQPSASSPPLTSTTMGTTGTPVTPCGYNFTKRGKGGISHVVNVNGDPNQTYTVTLKDKNISIPVNVSGTDEVEIPFNLLKPCTNYTVSVDDCSPKGDLTFVSSDEAKKISSTVTSLTDKEVCFKGEFSDDQKWDLTKCVEITVKNSCKLIMELIVLDTCSYTMEVHMPPVTPQIYFNEAIPSQFKWTNKPEQCSASLKINCGGSNIYDLNQSVSLFPDQTYSCFGEYSYEKKLIKSKTLEINVKCDWQKGNFINTSPSSFEISWNSHKDKCPGIKWTNYKARCEKHEGKCSPDKGNSTVCTINNLEAYTDYTCNIMADFKNKSYKITELKERTKSTRSIEFRVIMIIVQIAVFAAPTVILLQIICARRAGRKDSHHPEEMEMPTVLE